MEQRRRVKVYLLEEDDRWVDKGTGHITLPAHPTTGARFMRVVSEVPPNDVLLESQIRPEIQYARQEGTLIVWTELSNEDWAISFQEAEGCDEVWNLLQDIISRSGYDSNDLIDDYSSPAPANLLPDPNLGNLGHIRNIVYRLMEDKGSRTRLANLLMTTNYLSKLFTIFHKLEDLEASEDLAVLFDVAKNIVMIGHPDLYNVIVHDENFFDILGMLEYDPTVRGLPGTFRNFIKTQANHVVVLKRMDSEFQRTITRVYRLQYLKDVAIARYLDDPVYNNLNDAIRHLYSQLLRALLFSHEFCDEMVEIFTNPSNDPAAVQRRRNAAMFLKELSAIAKQSVDIRPHDLYSEFLNMGLFRVLRYGLVDSCIETRQATAELLTRIMDVDRKLVQTFCLSSFRQHGHSLVQVLITRLLEEEDEGLLSQYNETLKLLLEPESIPIPGMSLISCEAGGPLMRPNITPEYEEFQAMFYETTVSPLLAPLQLASAQGTVHNRVVSDTTVVQVLTLPPHHVERVYQIMELLTLMLKTNATRFKQFLVSPPPLMPAAAAIASSGQSESRPSLDFATLLRHLTVSTHKHLQLACIRIIRAMVLQVDEHYPTYLMQHQLLHAVVFALLITDSKYNLVNSAALELLDLIAQRKCGPHSRMLLHHVAVMTRYWPYLGYASKIFDQIRCHRTEDDALDDTTSVASTVSVDMDLDKMQAASAPPQPPSDANGAPRPLPLPDRMELAWDSDSSGSSGGSSPTSAPTLTTSSSALASAITDPVQSMSDEPSQSENHHVIKRLPLVRYTDEDGDDDMDSLVNSRNKAAAESSSLGRALWSPSSSSSSAPGSLGPTKKKLIFKATSRKTSDSPISTSGGGGLTSTSPATSSSAASASAAASPVRKKIKLSLLEIGGATPTV